MTTADVPEIKAEHMKEVADFHFQPKAKAGAFTTTELILKVSEAKSETERIVKGVEVVLKECVEDRKEVLRLRKEVETKDKRILRLQGDLNEARDLVKKKDDSIALYTREYAGRPQTSRPRSPSPPRRWDNYRRDDRRDDRREDRYRDDRRTDRRTDRRDDRSHGHRSWGGRFGVNTSDNRGSGIAETRNRYPTHYRDEGVSGEDQRDREVWVDEQSNWDIPSYSHQNHQQHQQHQQLPPAAEALKNLQMQMHMVYYNPKDPRYEVGSGYQHLP